MAGKPSISGAPWIRGCHFSLLYFLRVFAQNAVSHFSQPSLYGGCDSVSLDSSGLVTFGSSDDQSFGKGAAPDRWKNLHRSFIWQPGRNAVGDAGVLARVDLRGKVDDQSRVGFAEHLCPAGCDPARSDYF